MIIMCCATQCKYYIQLLCDCFKGGLQVFTVVELENPNSLLCLKSWLGAGI